MSADSSSQNYQEHLSRIETVWTMVIQAHGAQTSQITTAQEKIIERYSGAVYRYLLAVLRDRDAADEVLQEFALRVVKGGFRHANQDRGRFRDYVKTAVMRLVTDYYRRRKRRRPVFGGADIDNVGEVAAPSPTPDANFDESFITSCRDELLGRAWRGLQLMEESAGQPFYSVLNFRARHPETKSDAMAEALTDQLQPEKPFTAAGIRKTLERARQKFSELLLYEVSQMLGRHTPDELEEEVIELGLQPYCQSALSKRHRGSDG